MKPRIVHVKRSNTSHEYRDVYFDENLFALLKKREVAGQEDWFCEQIAKAFVAGQYDHLPYYVSRIRYIGVPGPHFGCYEVLYGDIHGSVYTSVINVSKAVEINSRATEAPQASASIEEVQFFPDFFNPDALSNSRSKKLFDNLNGYIKDFIRKKKKQGDEFFSGKIKLASKTPEKPELKVRKFSVEDCSLTEMLPLFFKENEAYAKLPQIIAKVKEDKKVFDEIATKIENSLQKANIPIPDKDDQDNPIVQIISYEFIQEINKKQNSRFGELDTRATDLQKNVIEKISPAYIEYKNDQEKLNFIKKQLAWALYAAAHQYYISEVQNKLQNRDRSKKIAHFNKHFAGIAQIDKDGSLTDIEIVYQRFQHKSLNEINEFIQELLKSANTSTGRSSNKLTLLINHLAKTAESLRTTMSEVADLSIPGLKNEELTFTATHKTLIASATFKFSDNLMKFESKANEKVKAAKESVVTSESTTPKKLDTFTQNATVNSNILSSNLSYKKRFKKFESYMNDVSHLQNDRIQIEKIMDEANKLVAQIDEFKKSIETKYKTIDNLKSTSEIKHKSDYKKLEGLIDGKNQLLQKLKTLQSEVTSLMLKSDTRERAAQLKEHQETMKAISSQKAELGAISKELANLDIDANFELINAEHADHQINIVDFQTLIENTIKKVKDELATVPHYKPDAIEKYEDLEYISLKKMINDQMLILTNCADKYADHGGLFIATTDFKGDSEKVAKAYYSIMETTAKLKATIEQRQKLDQLIFSLKAFTNLIETHDEEIKKVEENLSPEAKKGEFTQLKNSYDSNKKLITDALEAFSQSSPFVKRDVINNRPGIEQLEVSPSIIDEINALNEKCLNQRDQFTKNSKDLQFLPNLLALQSEIKMLHAKLPTFKEDNDNPKLNELIHTYNQKRMKVDKIHEKYSACNIEEFRERSSNDVQDFDDAETDDDRLKKVKEPLYQNYHEAKELQRQILVIQEQKSLFSLFITANIEQTTLVNKLVDLVASVKKLTSSDGKTLLKDSDPLKTLIQEFEGYKRISEDNNDYLAAKSKEYLNIMPIDDKLFQEFQRIQSNAYFAFKKCVDKVREIDESILVDHNQVLTKNIPQKESKPDVVVDNSILPPKHTKRMKKQFSRLYSLLSKCINTLEAKYAELNLQRSKEESTDQKLIEEIAIIKARLFDLKLLRTQLESDIFGNDLNEHRSKIAHAERNLSALKEQYAKAKGDAKSQTKEKLSESMQEVKDLKALYSKAMQLKHPEKLTSTYLINNMTAFDTIAHTLKDSLDVVQDQGQHGVRKWLGHFKEKFIDGIRSLRPATSNLSPAKHYSTTKTCRIIEKKTTSLLQFFKKKRLVSEQMPEHSPTVPSIQSEPVEALLPLKTKLRDDMEVPVSSPMLSKRKSKALNDPIMLSTTSEEIQEQFDNYENNEEELLRNLREIEDILYLTDEILNSTSSPTSDSKNEIQEASVSQEDTIQLVRGKLPPTSPEQISLARSINALIENDVSYRLDTDNSYRYDLFVKELLNALSDSKTFKQKIIEAYEGGHISLKTLILLNRTIINKDNQLGQPLKASDVAQLIKENDQVREKQNFFKRLFNRRAKTLHDFDTLVAKNDYIYACDAELILRLRNRRDSVTRTGAYQNDNVNLLHGKKGNNIYVMNQLPKNPLKYKYSYIYINNPKGESTLYYVSGKECNPVNFTNSKPLTDKLGKRKATWMNQEQVNNLITLNGGHIPTFDNQKLTHTEQFIENLGSKFRRHV